MQKNICVLTMVEQKKKIGRRTTWAQWERHTEEGDRTQQQREAAGLK